MIVVDRLEGTRAVLEVDGELVDVPRAMLPADVREGDVLRVVREIPAEPVEASPPDPSSDGGVIDL